MVPDPGPLPEYARPEAITPLEADEEQNQDGSETAGTEPNEEREQYDDADEDSGQSSDSTIPQNEAEFSWVDAVQSS